jgi:hypothetical protein
MLAQVTNDIEPFVNVETWLIALGAVTPFVTALLTKAGASVNVKSAVSALVTALVAVIVTGIEGGDLTVEKWFNGWVQIVISHGVTWLFTQKLVADVNANTPGVIGPRPVAPPAD